MRRTLVVLGALAVLAAALLVGPATGSAATAKVKTTTLYSCVDKKTGLLRIVSKTKKCTAAERKLTLDLDDRRLDEPVVDRRPQGSGRARRPGWRTGPRRCGGRGRRAGLRVAGAQGVPGAQGVQGPGGAAGAQGPAGPTGPGGGDPGPTGAQGPQGDTGATGPQGAQGEAGPGRSRGSHGPDRPAG